MTTPSIFGDISIEQFLTEYWQKKPLLIRGAFKEFDFPVDADELAGLACEDEVESRLIQQNSDGSNWQLTHGPLTEDSFSQLPEDNWTLLVQAVDHWVPDTTDLMEQFNFVPNWRLDDLMISYATPGGGVGPHYDNYDVFLIQAEGKRRWEIGGLFGEDSPRREDTPVMILPEWQAEQSWELEPGDMLYLPPRVGHNGVSLDNECLTYSVGFRAPSHVEIMQGFGSFMADRIASEQRYSDPDLVQQEHPAEITSASVTRLQNLLREYIDQPTMLQQWFGEYMTEPKYPEHIPASSEEVELEPGMMLARTEGARLAYIAEQHSPYQLFADGKSYTFEPSLLNLVQQVTKEIEFEIPEDAPTTYYELLNQLVLQGTLYLEETYEL